MGKIVKYLTLDTETATLPFVNEWNLSPDEKKKIAISKPLVYDIGWTIATRSKGVIYKRNFLIAEIFSVPSIFNTAYYKDKRPLYLEMIEQGKITIEPWNKVMSILIEDLKDCAYITAYNAAFDFKKAIPFTERYITALYSKNYYEWEERQKESCKWLLTNNKRQSTDFNKDYFIFRDHLYPMIDIWGLACKYLLNNTNYKRYCIENGRISNTGTYFSTNAETAMQYLSQRYDFIEEHTALSDAEIETIILLKCLKRGKLIQGIIFFPYKILGETVEFITKVRNITLDMAKTVYYKIRDYIHSTKKESSYLSQMRSKMKSLREYIINVWG